MNMHIFYEYILKSVYWDVIVNQKVLRVQLFSSDQFISMSGFVIVHLLITS